MTVEIRPARADEMGEFFRVANLALINSPEYTANIRPEDTLCGFENGKMTTSYATWPLTMRFNGNPVPVAAVTYVGTLPVSRRRGYLRSIKQLHFKNLYEQGEKHIAVLWASMAAIYQRYGYGVVATSASYDIEPRFLKFALPCDVTGSCREAGDDELQPFIEVHSSFIKNRNGNMERSEQGWKDGVMQAPRDKAHLCRIVYEENGKALAYVIYVEHLRGRFSEPSRISIRDAAWSSPASYRAIWEHLSNLDLIDHVTWWRLPPDDPLPHLLLEPRKLNRRTYDGILGRIVNLEKALPSRPYSAEGTLTFEVRDELCPWNEGRWKLEACTDGSRVSRTDEGPQLTMPVSTLAMLAFGQISASEAARMGRCDVSDPAALQVWDKVMRTACRPGCTDFF